MEYISLESLNSLWTIQEANATLGTCMLQKAEFSEFIPVAFGKPHNCVNLQLKSKSKQTKTLQ